MFTDEQLAQAVELAFGSGAQFSRVDPINHLQVEVLTTAKVGGLGFKDKTNQNPTGVKWEDFDFAFVTVRDPHDGGPATKDYLMAKYIPTGLTIDSDPDDIMSDGGEAYGTTLLQLAAKQSDSGE